jgi:Flp pilus assembly protein TadG
MRALMQWRLHRDERGVTAIIVALCLVALFGMLILVVDVGGLLLRRRAMVNGADAAALAAAKSCVIEDMPYEQAADDWAAANVAGVDTTPVNITAQRGCDPGDDGDGYVSVQYQAPQALFFAPVLGFGSQGSVTTAATAIFGPAGGGNPIPIAIYSNSFLSDCDIETVAPPQDCYFWFDNTGFGTSRFGFLNLIPASEGGGWDVPFDEQQCPRVGAPQLSDWIAQVDGGIQVDLNYTPTGKEPTYVCIIEGLASSVWDDLELREGDTLTFPVNRCDLTLPGDPYGQVERDGTEVACDTSPHKYDIIGFVDFELTQVLQSQQEWGGTSSTDCSQNNFRVTQNTTYAFNSFGPGGSCPTTSDSPLIDVSTILIDGKAPTDPTKQYTLNDANGDGQPESFTWTGPTSPPSINVSFTWWEDGACGEPPPNSSAVCIRVKTVEVRIGGIRPGGGADFGLEAVKLCEPAIAGSCDPIPVP